VARPKFAGFFFSVLLFVPTLPKAVVKQNLVIGNIHRSLPQPFHFRYTQKIVMGLYAAQNLPMMPFIGGSNFKIKRKHCWDFEFLALRNKVSWPLKRTVYYLENYIHHFQSLGYYPATSKVFWV
jgi:hypothetical protein